VLLKLSKTFDHTQGQTHGSFHHENAPAHRSKVCTEYLPSTGLKVLEHASSSSDLAPCDFALFPYIKKG
jgi:hypothetical protein